MLKFLFFILVLSPTLSLFAQEYTYKIAAALMFQNEGRHLKEWIEFHKLVGIDHFYLYDNLSEDDFYPEIEPYIASGEVEFFQYPRATNNQRQYVDLQCEIYNHALSLARGKVKWLTFIDGDEYLVPLEKETLDEALQEFDKVGGVYVNWLNFGTSHVEKTPSDRLRIESLLYSEGRATALGKSIVRPERVACCRDPHVLDYVVPYFHLTTSFQRFQWVSFPSRRRIQVFHYYTGDLDHLINVKFPRRRKWLPGLQLAAYLESMDSLNKTYTPFMLKFVPKVREALGLDPAL